MANFVVVVDRDSVRRSRYIETIQFLLSPARGLQVNSCCVEDFHAIWAAYPHAPVSWIANQQSAAVILGEAISQAGSDRMNAAELRDQWETSANRSFPLLDGFYAAVAYHSSFGVTVSADILGMFPIYYYTCRDVILVSSSPELFKHHPLFQTAFNPSGLVGILLTNGLFDGQTLWQNVRRLNAGYSVNWEPGKAPVELRQYEISALNQNSRQNEKLSFSEHLDILERLLDKTITRHAPNDKQYCLLLSGGLDSRMLAGFLHRQGIKPMALTLGKRTDLEMECAIPVARALGLEHHATEIPFDQYPLDADLLIKWEHLTNGFSNVVMGWGVYPHVNKLAPRVISGNSIELLIGGKGAYTISAKGLSFETFFTCGVNNWGISPKLLEKLLRQEVFGNLVQDTMTRIQTLYESYSEEEFKRSLYFDLYHRQRFHVGCAGWQLCFGAWPILPILDWQVLSTTATLAVEIIAKRRAQNELLCTRFPQLAALPLDRNDYNVEPLSPSKSRKLLARLFGLQRKWRRLQQKLGYERRYYYRTYDINNPGWRAVRQQAEPYRPLVQHLFHQDVFNQILPPPDVTVRCLRDPITESSSIKLLLGLLLWSRENL